MTKLWILASKLLTTTPSRIEPSLAALNDSRHGGKRITPNMGTEEDHHHSGTDGPSPDPDWKIKRPLTVLLHGSPTTSTGDYRQSTSAPGRDSPPDPPPQGYLLFNLSECMELGRYSTTLTQERVRLAYYGAPFKNVSALSKKNYHCFLNLNAPRGTVLETIQRQLTAACADLFVHLFEVRGMDARTLFSCMFGETASVGPNMDARSDVVQSNINTLKIQISRRSSSTFTHRHVIDITALPPPDKSRLAVTYNSSIAGLIQTPGLPDQQGYPAGMRSVVHVHVPRHHQIMFTFFIVDLDQPYITICEQDSVCLSSGAVRQHLGCYCYDGGYGTRLLNTRVLHVDFVSYRPQGNRTGFSLYFSFHHLSVLPTRLDNGQWNCSVPHWPDFRPHLVRHCNLFPNCQHGEDERECPYSSPRCPPSFFYAGAKCFSYVDPVADVTWREADDNCQHRGLRLASLSIPSQWSGVIGLLRQSRLPIDVKKIFLGIRYAEDALPLMYEDNLLWKDNTVAYYVHVAKSWKSVLRACGYISTDHSDPIRKTLYAPKDKAGGVNIYFGPCDKQTRALFLCEADAQPEEDEGARRPPSVLMKAVSNFTFIHVPHVRCPGSHLTHQFLACDTQAACWAQQLDGVISCSQAQLTPHPPSLTCSNEVQRVPYTLVCDFRSDCADNSDENLCVHPECSIDWFMCGINGQCVPPSKRCNDIRDCINGRDELQCSGIINRQVSSQTITPPAVIQFNFRPNYTSSYTVEAIDNVTTTAKEAGCPETHFQCADSGYCLPVFVRCNGVNDCPGKEDEMHCGSSYSCRGLYRCRGSTMCLHPRHLCDHLSHCPQRDDELFCSLPCPHVCICYGLAYFCNTPDLSVRDLELMSPQMRFLDASGTRTTPNHVANFSMMIHLSLSGCSLLHINRLRFKNLRSLDLSDNQLTVIDSSNLDLLPNLQDLSLAKNPLSLIQKAEFSVGWYNIRKLDLSHTAVSSLHLVLHSDNFLSLETLNLSQTRVVSISGSGFQVLSRLKSVDLRGCPLTTFAQDIFRDLHLLRTVYADNYKLCCPASLPTGFNLHNCFAPQDEISSCEDLLRSTFYRVFLFSFAMLALIGNLCSFVFRGISHKKFKNKAFNLFVTHLCVADFTMGLYLMMIGVADQLFRGTYLWKDVDWRRSHSCRAAGFLSLLSSEVSASIICLITMDRLLVLRFPLSKMHFSATSGHRAVLVAWALGLGLALVPLLPITSHWQFYGQNAICIPLPVTRKAFPGRLYSYSVMVVMNFVLFLLIALGQLVIYCSVRANSLAHSETIPHSRSQDLTIARRLITIAMSDFLCWFPIGLLGILAAQGVQVSGEVNVALAIFVLPLNSALNPFLYTLNVLRERRQRAMEKRWRLLMASNAKNLDK